MIVENFGGGIALESKKDSGSTFTFVVALEELCEEENVGESRCRNPLNIKYPRLKKTYKVDIVRNRDDYPAFTQWSAVNEDELPINAIIQRNVPDKLGSRDDVPKIASLPKLRAI